MDFHVKKKKTKQTKNKQTNKTKQTKKKKTKKKKLATERNDDNTMHQLNETIILCTNLVSTPVISLTSKITPLTLGMRGSMDGWALASPRSSIRRSMSLSYRKGTVRRRARQSAKRSLYNQTHIYIYIYIHSHTQIYAYTQTQKQFLLVWYVFRRGSVLLIFRKTKKTPLPSVRKIQRFVDFDDE